MEFSCKILGIIDPHLPYAGHRISKTHEYQLFSGAGFNELVIDRNDRWFQKKRDRGLVPGYNRNTGDYLAAGGDKAHRVGIGSGCPELQGKPRADSSGPTRISTSSHSCPDGMVPKW